VRRPWFLPLAVAVVLAACTPTDAPSTTGSTTTAAVDQTAPSSTLVPPPPIPQVVAPPLPSEDFAAYVFGVWASGNHERLEELTTETAYLVLASRPATEDDHWVFASCQTLAHNTFCAWTGTTEILSMRIDDYAASKGYAAVVDAGFRTAG
jgi:hypothetical protein